MRLFVWLWLVASSLVLVRQISSAETRPQYGGTLRIEIREEIRSLDPADNFPVDSLARRNVLGQIFETLVEVDDRGELHPGLATGWHAESGNQRWQFEIRKGVKFHDGSELTPETASASLRAANPAWKVFAQGDSVIVECAQADTDLPAELALTRNSIVKKAVGGQIVGTGPFRVKDWEPGKHLTLAAEEGYWRGRVFIDSVDVKTGKNFPQQMLELESNQADVVEILPEQSQRVAMAGHRVSSSRPVELVALVFPNEPHTPDEKMMRSALAHSIDRISIRDALLQGTGEGAACLLPNWMTGYAFAFSTGANLNLARQERELVRTAPNWTVSYDANDPLSRLLAERVALNAHDAGTAIRATAAANADLKVVRIPLVSTDPWVALNWLATGLGLTIPKRSADSMEVLYGTEKELLEQQRVIPLFHLPAAWAVSPAVRDWQTDADGRWRVENVWINKEKDRP
jgi:MarR-like DNA-binding transcriptional regulator SgrR of sgrS sRNA